MENLDDMIKLYAEALEAMGNTYGGEVNIDEISLVKANEETSKESTLYPLGEEYGEKELKTAVKSSENDRSEEKSAIEEEFYEEEADEVVEEETESAMTSTSEFFASVFAGEQAYPIEGARVVVYRDDNIFAFLETDRNGATKRVALPSFERENSLEADSAQRSVDYYADVFAEGFIPQKELLVSAVGGSEAFLRVLMIPESERVF